VTRKDYLLLSAALRTARDYTARVQPGMVAGVDVAASHVCSALSWDNRAFDAVRFMVDCGATVANEVET